MRSRSALLLAALSGASLPAIGQTPPAAATAPAAGQAAAVPASEPTPVLGRLFFTPEERARLDELRRKPPAEPQAAARPEEPQAPMPQYVTVNGVVRRSDGVSTVWLNDQAVQGGRAAGGIVVAPGRASTPANVTVRLPQIGRSVELKVGQQLEVNSGQIQEGYRAPRAAVEEPPASAGAVARETEPAPPPTTARRTNRQRDLLRDLLEEIEGPGAAPGQAPGASSVTR